MGELSRESKRLTYTTYPGTYVDTTHVDSRWTGCIIRAHDLEVVCETSPWHKMLHAVDVLCAAVSRSNDEHKRWFGGGKCRLFLEVRERGAWKKKKKKSLSLSDKISPCCRPIKEKADLMVPCQPSARTSCREYPTEAHS